jgi:N-acetyl-anhydromuramyl-L-alanine amidase AmpD
MITKLEGPFKFTKRKTKKTQFLLCNTLRPYNHFINSLRYRNEGACEKLPHYVITKKGEIFSVVPSEYYSVYLSTKNTIVVALENLGWLQKNPLAPMYSNWIGDVYRGEPFTARWKERLFWDPYSVEQITALTTLIEMLSVKHNIQKTFIGHNNPITAPQKFKGILSRCNLSHIYEDISPAFDTKLFEKLLQNEKQETKRVRANKKDAQNNQPD